VAFGTIEGRATLTGGGVRVSAWGGGAARGRRCRRFLGVAGTGQRDGKKRSQCKTVNGCFHINHHLNAFNNSFKAKFACRAGRGRRIVTAPVTSTRSWSPC